MSKYCFNLKKYAESLAKENISPSLRRYFMRMDAKLQGKEVKFISRKDSWGFVVGDRGMANRDWCVKEKSKLKTWADSIGRRIKNFEDMQ